MPIHFGPPHKPNIMANRINAETWEHFGKDTADILNRRRRQVLALTFMVQFLSMTMLPIPRWFPDDTVLQDAGLVVFALGGVGLLVGCFTCLRMNSEGVHKEIQDVRNRYAADFRTCEIDLIYLRDGRDAYWVFRPIRATI